MTSPETTRVLLGLLLGVTAAGANVLGGSLIAHGRWSRRYLKYFIALGAGFMLATALLEMIPESSPAARLPA
jgi:ZIP family zinc transporter/zinc and cadmium transporter